MKHILVPIGSTENASNTLQYAIDFASDINAKVFVFRAYNVQTKAGTFINVDGIIERETNLYLRTIVKTVDTKDVSLQLISAKGSVLDSINSIDAELGIDLIVMGPKSNSIKEEVFLGSTSGSVVKQTQIPVLIVPNNYKYKPVKHILTAFKSGIINKENVLTPLQFVLSHFKAKTNLLLVKTPEYTEADLQLDKDLEHIKDNLITTENPTTFQGVLAHLKSENPDMLCVFRRKRGFFAKLWESNTILKEEFYCEIPLLVLQGKL